MQEAEAFDDEVHAVTDAAGGFEARLPRRTLRAAVIQDGVAGHPVAFTPSPGDVTDVGDLEAPGDALARWTLHFEDHAAKPCPGVLVALGREDSWSMRLHPSFDAEWFAIRSAVGGVFRIALPCRVAPVVIGVGSKKHTTRALALDCGEPGLYEARIVLEPRSHVVVRLCGATVDEFLRMRPGLSVEPTGGEDVIDRELAAVDALSGSAIGFARGDSAPPANMLEFQLARCAVPTLVGRETHLDLPRAGTYDVRLTVDGVTVVSERAEVPVSAGLATLEVRVPEGRVVTVDSTQAAAWARDIPEAFFVSYAAWPCAPTPPSGGDPQATGAAIVGPIAELRRTGASYPQELRLWVPSAAACVAFGFLEVAGGGALLPSTEWDVVHMAVPAEREPRLVMPVREAYLTRTTTVRVQLYHAGSPFACRNVPISVLRRFDGPVLVPSRRGFTKVFTDDRGRAEVRLPPGRYGVHLDASMGRPSGAVVEVSPGSAAIEVPIDVVFVP